MAIEHKNYNPDLMAGADNSTTGPTAITSTSNQALAVGRQGATGPAFNVNASTASQADGIGITGLAAGNGAAIATITTGTNAPLTIDAAGSGTIKIGDTSTGAVTIKPATTITGVATFTAIPVFSAGVPGFFQTDASAATIAVTAAQTGGTFLATKGSATQTYTLPAATAGLSYTFICGHASGEILIDPTAGDDITITTFAAVGADCDTAIVTTTGATGIKNTAATNAVGDSVTLVSDGVKWYGVGITSGIWAAQ